MKYSEAKKQIEALSSKYSAKLNDFPKYFNINYKGSEIAYIDGEERYGITVWKHFSKLPFSNKLYMILAELAMTPLDKRVEERKRRVKVFDGLLGYLNIDTVTGKVRVYDKDETYALNGTCIIKTKFTNKEIKQLKQRDDVPLDWNKVKLEEA